ncbi:hypothetical protein EDB85DRAFT_2024739, partial [Lactarius pseudohatsudake]
MRAPQPASPVSHLNLSLTRVYAGHSVVVVLRQLGPTQTSFIFSLSFFLLILTGRTSRSCEHNDFAATSNTTTPASACAAPRTLTRHLDIAATPLDLTDPATTTHSTHHAARHLQHGPPQPPDPLRHFRQCRAPRPALAAVSTQPLLSPRRRHLPIQPH